MEKNNRVLRANVQMFLDINSAKANIKAVNLTDWTGKPTKLRT